MKKYRHLFFDLDNTIWNFDKSSEETIRELYYRFDLRSIGIVSFEKFLNSYSRHNKRLWNMYRLGKVDKEFLRHERFRRAFLDFKIPEEKIPANFEDEYVRLCPIKTYLFPEAHKVLSILSRKYHIHIITNGFLESSMTKIRVTGIAKYIDNINISEVIGSNKPNPDIFKFALKKANALVEESIMIGDNIEADINGAVGIKMDAVFFNPKGLNVKTKATYEIKSLSDLLLILNS